MADITMCDGVDCPIKETCYRFTAPKSEHWQAFFVETPTLTEHGCEMFWSNEGYRKHNEALSNS